MGEALLERLEERDRLADRAYRAIREGILDGRISPGTQLSVPELSRQLGISRSPVREALFSIERDGLARSLPRKGTVVVFADLDDLEKLYQIREVLEGLAARLAVSRLKSSDLKQLDDLVVRHEAAVAEGDIQSHIDIDLAFHRAVRSASGSHYLIESLDRLEGQIRLALYSTASVPGNMTLALRDHKKIIKALQSDDPERAESEARKHVSRVWDGFVKQRSQRNRSQQGGEVAQ